MSRFTVTWDLTAQEQLARIWLEADDRQRVTPAADCIDGELAEDPRAKGSLLAEGLRVLYVPPLHVCFTVSELDRLVEVVSIRIDIARRPRRTYSPGPLLN
jgi:hypothetical protein